MEKSHQSSSKTSRVACPCCGYLTLGARADYEICALCGWHDEPGVDNSNPDEGPNLVRLNVGRFNYLKFAVSDPDNTRKGDKQSSLDFEQGRIFSVIDSGERPLLQELNSNGDVVYQAEVFFEDEWKDYLASHEIKLQSPPNAPSWPAKK